MESEVSSKAPAGTSRSPGLSTVYVPLNHKHHEQANVLYGIVGNPRDSLPPVDSRQYLDFYHRVMKAIDSVVAQHAVAKVTGTVDGVLLVTGVLAPQEHPALALANCALHLLRISRQVQLPNGEPLQLKLGMHVGAAYTGMLGTSPPHFQVIGYTVQMARSLAEQGIPNFLQLSQEARKALGATAATDSNWFSGGTIVAWPGEKVEVALTCCDFQKAQTSELLKVLIPRSRFAQQSGRGQSLALTFADAELEARFERWFDDSTAVWELAGSWALVLCALLWVLAQWRLFGYVSDIAMWMVGASILTAVLLTASLASSPPMTSLRSMMWFSHHALLTQQTVSSALKGPALVPTAARDDVMTGAVLAASAGTQQLALVLLQGALLLSLCTIVHKARFSLHVWAVPVLTAAAGGALAVHFTSLPPETAPSGMHLAAFGGVAGMLAVPAVIMHCCEWLARKAFIVNPDDLES